MFKKAMAAALALGLLTGGVILAEKYYVAVKGAEVSSEPDPFADVIATPKINDTVEVDKDELDPLSTNYVKGKLADGKTGWIKESSLSAAPSDASEVSAEKRVSAGQEGAGAAARGFTNEIEGETRKNDKELDARLKQLDALQAFVSQKLRGSPSGKYEDGSSSALRQHLRQFKQEGGLK